MGCCRIAALAVVNDTAEGVIVSSAMTASKVVSYSVIVVIIRSSEKLLGRIFSLNV